MTVEYTIELAEEAPGTAAHAWVAAAAVAPLGKLGPLWARVALEGFAAQRDLFFKERRLVEASCSERLLLEAACTFHYTVTRDTRAVPELSGGHYGYHAPEGTHVQQRQGAVVLSGSKVLPLVARGLVAAPLLGVPPTPKPFLPGWIRPDIEAVLREEMCSTHGARKWLKGRALHLLYRGLARSP